MMMLRYLHINTVHAKLALLIPLFCVLLSSCNFFESEQDKLQKAKGYYDNNEFNQSIVMVKNILQSDPKSCDARVLLGKNQFAKFSLVEAQDTFAKAVNHGCVNQDLFYYTVKILLYRNQLLQASALFTNSKYASVVKNPINQLLRAELYFLQHDNESADKAYSKYYELTHDAGAECLRQVMMLVMNDKYQDVVDKTQYCESQYAGNEAYDINRSRYLRAIAQLNLKQSKQAHDTLNNVVEKYTNPKDPAVKVQSLLLILKLELANKEIDSAAKVSDELHKYIVVPDMFYAKGLKFEKDQRLDLAEQQFLEALKLLPNHKPSLLALADLKYKEGNFEQAKYYTGKLDALTGKTLFSDKLDELLAVQYFRSGDLDSIINKLPHDKKGTTLKTQYILAMAYAKKGNRDKAMEVFGNIEKQLSDVEKKELLKARLDILMGENKKAEAIFQKYASKGNIYAITGLSLLYMQEHEYPKAERILISAIKSNKQKSKPALLLAKLYSDTNQKQKLFNLLNDRIKEEPNSLSYQLALAGTYYKYAMYKESIKQCDHIIQMNPRVVQAYIVKANTYIRQGKYVDASAVYSDLIKRNNKNAYAYLMLAILANKESNHSQAISYVDKALAINPLYLNAAYAKIEFLSLEKKHDQALSFAKSTAKLIVDKSIKNKLLAFAFNRTGDDKNAYLHYKEALAEGDENIRTALQVYKFSKTINGADLAGKELDGFMAKHPGQKNTYYVANYFMGAKNYSLAEKYYESYVTQNHANPAAYNNLAWIKLHAGDKTSALKYAGMALKLAPDSAPIMDTMGLILLRSGEFDKAEPYLIAAHQKLKNNPSVIYHLALNYFKKKNYTQSKALLEGVIHTNFPELQDAKLLLGEINNKH